MRILEVKRSGRNQVIPRIFQEWENTAAQALKSVWKHKLNKAYAARLLRLKRGYQFLSRESSGWIPKKLLTFLMCVCACNFASRFFTNVDAFTSSFSAFNISCNLPDLVSKSYSRFFAVLNTLKKPDVSASVFYGRNNSFLIFHFSSFYFLLEN